MEGKYKAITLCLVSIASLFVTSTVSEFSADDCWALGYNKANLLCSSCNQLQSFDLEVLREHCLQCCTRDADSEKLTKYHSAILEVCTCKFGAYPQIQAFIKSDRIKKFKNLRVNYVRGLDPIIKLLNKRGEVEETLAIDKWNTDSVEEFLSLHLRNDSNEDDDDDFLRTNMV